MDELIDKKNWSTYRNRQADRRYAVLYDQDRIRCIYRGEFTHEPVCEVRVLEPLEAAYHETLPEGRL